MTNIQLSQDEMTACIMFSIVCSPLGNLLTKTKSSLPSSWGWKKRSDDSLAFGASVITERYALQDAFGSSMCWSEELYNFC